MRKLRGDRAGMSEIVGALMLTLVVVVAASSFAVFVSEKQKSVQEQELYNLRKSQESIQIIDFMLNYTATGAEYWDLNFTITSNHARESQVTKVTINGHVASEFYVWRINRTSANWEEEALSWSEDFKVQAKEQLYLRLNRTNLFETDVHFLNGTFVKLEVFTVLLNSFTRVFMPPDAVMSIRMESLWDGSAFRNYIVLDGSGSQAQDGAFMTMYRWDITRISDLTSQRVTGMKASYVFPTTGESYWVNLTVMDDHGLMGSDSVEYSA